MGGGLGVVGKRRLLVGINHGGHGEHGEKQEEEVGTVFLFNCVFRWRNVWPRSRAIK